jgi:hypothetical protein
MRPSSTLTPRDICDSYFCVRKLSNPVRAAHPVFASAEPEYGYRSGLNSLPHYLSYYTPCAMVNSFLYLARYNTRYVRNCSRTTIQLFKKFLSFLRCVRIDTLLFFTTRCSHSCFIHWHIIHPLVGVQGFEPWTPWSQTRCATRLRYTPN